MAVQELMWCTLCGEAPAEGILEVVNKNTLEHDFWPCCNPCVENLNSQDWIDNEL